MSPDTPMEQKDSKVTSDVQTFDDSLMDLSVVLEDQNNDTSIRLETEVKLSDEPLIIMTRDVTNLERKVC